MLAVNDSNFEARSELAVARWREQQRFEAALYKYYLANYNIEDNAEFSLEKFKAMRKDYASQNPTNPSLSNAIGSIDKVYYETLYQKNPKRARTTLENRTAGEWMTYLLLFASALSASFGPTVVAALILAIFSPALLVGSVLYLCRSVYDYFNTPKSERTPLQKFNMLSSMPSTLLVALFVNAAMASLFAPGAFLITLAIGAAWFGYKIWQADKGSSIKWAEYKNTENQLESINQELETLTQAPAIRNHIERLEALASLEQLKSDPKYVNQRRAEEQLHSKLRALDSSQPSSTSSLFFNPGVQQQQQGTYEAPRPKLG